MKASRRDLGGHLDRPSPTVRFYLFHGPDESQSRGHGERLLTAVGAEKFSIAGSAVKSDPALLADEAGAMNLFGGKRALWVEPAGEEIVAGVEALLAGPPVESVVVAVTGALRKTGSLLKLAEASKQAIAYASYPLEGGDAEQMIVALGRTEGLRIERGLAARLAHACGNDRGVAAQEVAKLALYEGASPETPKELRAEALEAVGAEMAEGDWFRLADLALAGDLVQLANELARLPHGSEAIPVIRALQRRLLMIMPLRARVDSGESSDDVMRSLGKSLFFKDEPLLRKLLARWDSAGLARVVDRVSDLERRLMLPGPPPAVDALGEELIAIGRAAKRQRA